MTKYLELIQYKVLAELRVEMARAYLGLLWWVVEPLLYMTVFYVIFAILFERGGPGFVPFLLCGLVVWRWFDSTARSGMEAIPSNRSLMQQVYVPKLLFPLIIVFVNTIKFLIILALLIVFLLLYGAGINVQWMALPVLIVTQFLLIVTTTSALAMVVPFLPDLRIFVNNGLTLLFFLSGVFFALREMPEPWQSLLYLNPMAVLIESFRNVLLEARWPDWYALGLIQIGSLICYWLVYRLFRRFDRIYPKLAL